MLLLNISIRGCELMIKKDRVTVAELLLRGLIVFILVLLGTLIIFPFAKGVPLRNIPDYKEIVSIEIYDERTDEYIISINEDEIYYTVCCIDFLKTEINSDFKSEENGFLSIKFNDTYGNTTVIYVDENFVYYNGIAKSLKNKNIFIDAIEKMYF